MDFDDALDPALERIGHGHHMLRVMLETHDPETGGEAHTEVYVWFEEQPVLGTRFNWRGTTFELLDVNEAETSYAAPADGIRWETEDSCAAVWRPPVQRARWCLNPGGTSSIGSLHNERRARAG